MSPPRLEAELDLEAVAEAVAVGVRDGGIGAVGADLIAFWWAKRG